MARGVPYDGEDGKPDIPDRGEAQVLKALRKGEEDVGEVLLDEDGDADADVVDLPGGEDEDGGDDVVDHHHPEVTPPLLHQRHEYLRKPERAATQVVRCAWMGG